MATSKDHHIIEIIVFFYTDAYSGISRMPVKRTFLKGCTLLVKQRTRAYNNNAMVQANGDNGQDTIGKVNTAAHARLRALSTNSLPYCTQQGETYICNAMGQQVMGTDKG